MSIPEPLNIGAQALLRGVDYTHCGELEVLIRILKWKKWRHRYIIISQGCLYMYENKNSKKPEKSYSLQEFEKAQECDPCDGESICFCLRYKKAEAPLLFACDTPSTRETWIGRFFSAFVDLQSQRYNVSGDSGFGSAETNPHLKFDISGKEEYAGYDVVDERRFGPAKVHPVQPDDITYEDPTVTKTSNTVDNDMFYENVQVSRAGNKKDHEHHNPQRGVKTFGHNVSRESNIKQEKKGPNHSGETQRKVAGAQNVFMDELKTKMEEKRVSTSHKPNVHPKPAAMLSVPAQSVRCETDLNYQRSILAPSSTTSSFASVRDGAWNTNTDQGAQCLYIQEQESLYVNKNDNDKSSDSGNTSPVIYENPEPQKFEKANYFCPEKKDLKRRMDQKTVGTFAVFPGESTELVLCVMTQIGMKYFRIYSQDGRLSLYRSHEFDTFRSLDDLLSYYYLHDLPASTFNVKLLKGYKSV